MNLYKFKFQMDLKYHLITIHFYYTLCDSITVNVIEQILFFPCKYSRPVTYTKIGPLEADIPRILKEKMAYSYTT